MAYKTSMGAFSSTWRRQLGVGLRLGGGEGAGRIYVYFTISWKHLKRRGPAAPWLPSEHSQADFSLASRSGAMCDTCVRSVTCIRLTSVPIAYKFCLGHKKDGTVEIQRHTGASASINAVEGCP